LRVDASNVLDHPIPVAMQQSVSWLQRKIAFEQRPLGEVADEFNRYGSIPIEIDEVEAMAKNKSSLDGFVAKPR